MKIKFTPLLFFILLFPALLFQSCRKIDLERVAAVETGTAEVSSNSSVKLTGVIIDAGEPNDMIGYGFVYSTNPTPTNADREVVTGNSSATGAYQSTITNLTPGTWYFRAYANTSSNGFAYGKVMTFTITQQAAVELYYGTGVADDIAGFDFPGPYMPLLYFDKADLQPYIGFMVVSFSFFPGSVNPESFSIYLEQTTFYEQNVTSPIAGSWNEIQLNQPFIINDANLYAGYWVYNQPFNSLPCGIDAGPAYNGFGNLIFYDGALYSSGINANWCIKLKIANMKGEQIEISLDASSPPPIDKDKPRVSHANKSVLPLIYSQSKNANQ